MLKRISQIIYVILGILLILKGLQVSTDWVDSRKVLNALELKIIVFSFSAVFFWAAFNVTRIDKLNYIFLFFAFVLASFHWLDLSSGYSISFHKFIGEKMEITTAIIHSLPFVLLLITSFINRYKQN